LNTAYESAYIKLFYNPDQFFATDSEVSGSVSRVLAGISSPDPFTSSDSQMTKCLESGNKPEGIILCEGSVLNTDLATSFTGITGVQVLYGNAGPRCSFTDNSVNENGGYQSGIQHGTEKGTCNTFYFYGWNVETIVFYEDTSTGALAGIKLSYGSANDIIGIVTISAGTTDVSGQTTQTLSYPEGGFFGFESAGSNQSLVSEIKAISVNDRDGYAILGAEREIYENNLPLIA